MFGLKLRYQIAGFLFVLFTTVVLIMGYFNMSILGDLLSRFAFHQAETSSDQIFNYLERILPQDVTSLEPFMEKTEEFQEIIEYIGKDNYIGNIVIYNLDKQPVYSFNSREETFVNYDAYLDTVQETRIMYSIVLAIDHETGRGKPIDSYRFTDSRMIYNEFYYPIIRNGRFLGTLRVSMKLQIATNLMRLFLVGNGSLAFIFIITAFIALNIWSGNAIDRPIQNLVQAQEQLRRGDFNAHVDLNLPTGNDLGKIANSFNMMTKELKEYQEELKTKASQLEEVNKQYRNLNETLEQEVERKTLELKEFYSMITHDLKIPVAAIKGYTELLKKEKTGPLNPKQEQFISSIGTATVHLLNMVKNMLDSVKYDDGRVEYYMDNFNLCEVVEEVKEHILPIINEKNIEFSIDIPDDCLNAYGDKVKIGQVISNIIGNAINYTPNGGTITFTAGKKRGVIEIRISDTGIGIPPEQMSRIFEKFQRVPDRETPSTSLGLGLYIVKKIMEGHGMKVWVDSEEGKGTTFFLTLKSGIPGNDNVGENSINK
jgi:signal transduction histidine kinase